MIMSGTVLTQTARIIMAAFQIGALVTKAVVKPLYKRQIWELMSPPMLSKLNAVGMSNLLMFEAVRDCHHRKRFCNMANALTMFGTGAVYVIFPVKGLAINIPFVGSLLFVGIINVLNLQRLNRDMTESKPGPSPMQLPALSLMLTGVSSFLLLSNRVPWSSSPHRSIISKVYLSQLAMNSATAGVMELYSSRKNEVSRKHLYLALLGFFCTKADMKPTGAIAMSGAALSAIRLIH